MSTSDSSSVLQKEKQIVRKKSWGGQPLSREVRGGSPASGSYWSKAKPTLCVSTIDIYLRLPMQRLRPELPGTSEAKKQERELLSVLAEGIEVCLGVIRPVACHVDISHSDLSLISCPYTRCQ